LIFASQLVKLFIMIDRILKFLYGSLFFLTPLIFATSTSELFEFNKMIFIYLITILIGFFWLLKMILAKKMIFKKTPLDIPIILFLFSQVMATIFSIDRHVSFFGYYGRFNGGLLSIISYIILYYGFVSNSFDILSLLKISLWSSVLVMIYGLPGKLGHDLTCFLVSRGRSFDNSCWSRETNVFDPANRSFSTLGQPNWLGAYLAINFFIGIYFLFRPLVIPSESDVTSDESRDLFKISLPVGRQVDFARNDKINLIYIVYLFVNFSFILFSRSRSALAAVGIGLVLFVAYYLLFIKLNAKKLIITLLLITVVPILLFKTGIERVDKYLSISNIKYQISKIHIKNKKDLKNNITIEQYNNASSVTESLDIRKIVWKGAIDLGLRYPFFGTGVETFAYSYNFVRPKQHNLTSEWDFIYNKAHNEFLNYLATTGFVGLLTYLGFIIFFIVYVINNLKTQISNVKTKSQMSKPKKDLKILDLDLSSRILVLSLLTAWLTILITNFFGFSTTTINLFFYLIPALVFYSSSEEESDESRSSRQARTINNKLSLYQYLSIFIISVSTIYLLFSTFAYWLADTQYALGLNYLKPQIADYQNAASYFERALKIRKEPVYEDRFSSSLSYLSAVASYQKQNEMAKQLISLSDYYNKKSLNSSSKNIFYWKTRAKNQYLFYQVSLDSNKLLEGIKALQVGVKLAPTDPKIPYSLAVYYSLLSDAEKKQIQKDSWQKQSLVEINKAIELKKDFLDGLNLKKELLKKYGLL